MGWTFRTRLTRPACRCPTRRASSAGPSSAPSRRRRRRRTRRSRWTLPKGTGGPYRLPTFTGTRTGRSGGSARSGRPGDDGARGDRPFLPIRVVGCQRGLDAAAAARGAPRRRCPRRALCGGGDDRGAAAGALLDGCTDGRVPPGGVARHACGGGGAPAGRHRPGGGAPLHAPRRGGGEWGGQRRVWRGGAPAVAQSRADVGRTSGSGWRCTILLAA